MNKKLILEERLVKNFKALCGVDLLKEDKIYPSNVDTAIKNKLKRNDEEVSNMIAIFGLFRNQSPFKEVGDISKITSFEELKNLFDEWYRLSTIQLLRTNEFLDDNENAKRYLDAYVQNVKSLGQNAQPFTFKNIENSLVDVVNNNRWIKDEGVVKRSEFSMEKPKDDDVLFESDDILIIDGGSRAKCVIYGDGEKWCISNRFHNMFNSYRINQGATIYFVLQRKVEGDERKLVILNYNGRYSIADRTNTGNRAGSSSNAKPWSNVESEIPNLRGKEEFFKYKPVTGEERKYHENVSERYTGDDIIGYVRKNTQGLYLNNSLVTPTEFFTDYILNAVRGELPDNQFNQLWKNRSNKEVDEMIMKYLETGTALNEYQFRIIEKG